MNVSRVLVMISVHTLFLLILLLPAGGTTLPARKRKRWQSARQCFSSSSICQEVFTLSYCSKSVQWVCACVCVRDDKTFARRLLHCFSCVFARVKLSSPPSDSLASFHAIWLNLLCFSFLERKNWNKRTWI